MHQKQPAASVILLVAILEFFLSVSVFVIDFLEEDCAKILSIWIEIKIRY